MAVLKNKCTEPASIPATGNNKNQLPSLLTYIALGLLAVGVEGGEGVYSEVCGGYRQDCQKHVDVIAASCAEERISAVKRMAIVEGTVEVVRSAIVVRIMAMARGFAVEGESVYDEG